MARTPGAPQAAKDLEAPKGDIYTKLLEFQKQQLVLKKKGENPHFESKFVPLNEVLQTIIKPLNDMGILVMQLPQADGLKTILRNVEDSTFIESFLPYVEVNNAQKVASNNTYNRRIALITMLGLGDKDDDGNAAAGNTGTPPPTTPLPDGSQVVTVVNERRGEKDGRPWQKVATDKGQAWVQDTNGEVLEAGTTYDVVAKGGTIMQARKVQ